MYLYLFIYFSWARGGIFCFQILREVNIAHIYIFIIAIYAEKLFITGRGKAGVK